MGHRVIFGRIGRFGQVSAPKIELSLFWLVLALIIMSLSKRQLLGLVAAAAIARSARAATPEVDLALVLAIDCSYSVNATEYHLQMSGLGRAFMNPQVFDAIAQGHRKKIALSAFLWSEEGNQKLIIPWRTIATSQQAVSIGSHLVYTAREISPGGTSISGALLYAQKLLATAPTAFRRVIDVSTDGRNNSGLETSGVRDQLSTAGITINALAIVNEVRDLTPYLKNQVTSGDGSFVITANSYEAYGEAILKKLVKEIEGPELS
jgi:Protein of unknown function (DUF1194)